MQKKNIFIYLLIKKRIIFNLKTIFILNNGAMLRDRTHGKARAKPMHTTIG